MSTPCKKCIEKGRYSRYNLLIDFREIKHQLDTNTTIMAGDYVQLCETKNEILKRLLLDNTVQNCDCQI